MGIRVGERGTGRPVIARPRRGRSNPPPSERGRLTHLAAELAGDAPRLAEWLNDTTSGSLAFYVLGREDVRRKLGSTSAVERCHEEVRRRTRVIRLFRHDAGFRRWLIAPTFEREEPSLRRTA